MSSSSMFRTAAPYGGAVLAVGLLGAYVAVAAFSTVIKIIGVAVAFFGAYAFLNVVQAGTKASTDQEFHSSLGKTLVISAGSAIYSMIRMLASAAFNAILGRVFSPHRH